MAMRAWSVMLVCVSAALAAAFAAELQFEVIPEDDRIGQHDVLFRQRPNQRNGVGGPCRNSGHCQAGMCCQLGTDRTRTCQPLSRIGQRCSEFQVKGGAYPDFCPCLQGICDRSQQSGQQGGVSQRAFRIGVCVPDHQGQRPVTAKHTSTHARP